MEELFEKAMKHLTVVVPVFNEEPLIHELVKRVTLNLKLITEDFEIIVVDDGSQDKTWNTIEIETEMEKRIKGIKFSRNFGHHYAITAGINASSSDWVVIMDGDLQDRPEVIPELYSKAIQGYEVVFVNRQDRTDSKMYLLLQRIFYLFLNLLTGLNFNHKQANFSIISNKVVQAFRLFPDNSRYYMTTVKWLGFNSATIDAEQGNRFSGKSSYSFQKRIKLATDIIISFSERPLRFAVSLGLLISLTSLFAGLAIVIKKLTTGFSEIGWAGVMVSIFFTTGIVLMVIGILGVYIGKIFLQVKNRPLYIIDKKIN
jgi:glycosyltransferase involved in cell wall biosynthesis